ncbi:hypothetical protein [Providencia sp. PROV230]|uniref:hypothetical protein n=1 Tax=Providencia sp. PROV230 TaxID=2949922 RepID=UPI002349DF77|nr:hypothetical protein [Providencia sp. PROV230]
MKISLNEEINSNNFKSLESFSRKLNGGTYRLVLPRDKQHGKLMTHSSPDMEGLKTTSIVIDGKIAGTAGLEEIDLDSNEILLLKSFQNYTFLAQAFNSLSTKLDAFISINHDQYQAKINNIFHLIDDLTKKLPFYVQNEKFGESALKILSNLRFDAGEYFEYNKSEFLKLYQYSSEFDYHWNTRYPKITLINHLNKQKNHTVFDSFKLLCMIDILEILILNQYDQGYIAATRSSLINRITPIIELMINDLNKFKGFITEYKEKEQNKNKQYLEHLESNKKFDNDILELDSLRPSLLSNKVMIENYLNDSLNLENIEEYIIKVDIKNI